jgi:hypothetical protein
MADPPATTGGGGIGGALKQKFGPLPVWLWLVIITAAGLAYYLWESSHSKKKTASSDQAGQHTMAGQPGVVVINQDQPPPGGGGGGKGKGHKGKHHHHKPPKEPDTRQISVTRDETLGQLAQQRHWSDRTLATVENENVTQGEGRWTSSTDLTKGEEVVRPLGG